MLVTPRLVAGRTNTTRWRAIRASVMAPTPAPIPPPRIPAAAANEEGSTRHGSKAVEHDAPEPNGDADSEAREEAVPDPILRLFNIANMRRRQLAPLAPVIDHEQRCPTISKPCLSPALQNTLRCTWCVDENVDHLATLKPESSGVNASCALSVAGSRRTARRQDRDVTWLLRGPMGSSGTPGNDTV